LNRSTNTSSEQVLSPFRLRSLRFLYNDWSHSLQPRVTEGAYPVLFGRETARQCSGIDDLPPSRSSCPWPSVLDGNTRPEATTVFRALFPSNPVRFL